MEVGKLVFTADPGGLPTGSLRLLTKRLIDLYCDKFYNDWLILLIDAMNPWFQMKTIYKSNLLYNVLAEKKKEFVNVGPSKMNSGQVVV